MKIKFKYYFIHYNFLVILTILSLLAYWWGWHNSNEIDGMPFSRSGAIATAILLTYLVSNYTERLAYVLEDVTKMIQNRGNWTDASKYIRNDLQSKIKTKLDNTKSIIQYWYMFLMLIATLIWGLGDQFYLLANDQAISTCELVVKIVHLQTK